MSRKYERKLTVDSDDGMVRIELTLVRNGDVKVFPLYLTPFEAGQLVGMVNGTLNQMFSQHREQVA